MKFHYIVCASTLYINWFLIQFMSTFAYNQAKQTEHRPVPKAEYFTIVKYSTLLSTDLLLSYNGTVFMGVRQNNPAKSYWFTPGVRLYKGEHPKQGIMRIFQTELGLHDRFVRSYLQNTLFLYKGCYEHYYPIDNFRDISGVSTHYFTHAFFVELNEIQYRLISEKSILDSQHKEVSWIPMDAIRKGWFDTRPIHPFVQQFFWNTQNRIDSFWGIE